MRGLLRLAIFFVFGVLASAAAAVFAYQAWLREPVEVARDVPEEVLDGASAFRRGIAVIYPVGSDHAAVAADLAKRGFAVTELDNGYRASLRWQVQPCIYRNVVNWQTDSNGKVSQISGDRFSRCR